VAKPKPPAPRTATVRDALREALRGRPLTARELSAAVGIPEKQVAEHIEHLRRSLAAVGGELVVEPARCLGCEFEFADRRRASKPGRCPKCKSERIDPPRFRVIAA
jgi:predicted Zn-ribbon and HTH transcriptional regulator